jgi:hypothetical protein
MEHYRNSKMSMIYELRDSLKEGIEKNKELLEVENEFKEIIENSGKYEKFAFMLQDWETNRTQLENAIETMKQRIRVIDALILSYEKQDEISKIVDLTVTMVIEALGIRNDVEEEQTAEVNIEL